MKIKPYVPVYTLTYLTLAAGMIVIGITYFSEISISQSLIPVIKAFDKLEFDLLLLIYSAFALSVFVILKTRIKIIRKPKATDAARNVFRYALIGILLVLLLFVYLLSGIWNIDLISYAERYTTKIEFPRIHSWLLLLSSVLTAALADASRINREEKLRQEERRYTLAITMRTVQDIVGNFMNSIQLYRLQAEESQALDKASLADLDKLIYTTSDRINTLASLKFVAEKEISTDLYVLDTSDEFVAEKEPEQ